ncbi:hypothetical protein [Halobacillus sp. Marseille-P3879]|uniref:hypothetical protein n=1 Tax=Halobacillus TaxID=45667 RepID=UPI000C7E81F0|nr:hypothetical protein [Halobacillus sp. Marseille-P3879]
MKIDNMEAVMENLNDAHQAVQRAQADPNGYTEAQQHVKQAEEMLSEARRNPNINNAANTLEWKRAADLLRMIEETSQAISRR